MNWPGLISIAALLFLIAYMWERGTRNVAVWLLSALCAVALVLAILVTYGVVNG